MSGVEAMKRALRRMVMFVALARTCVASEGLLVRTAQ